MRVKLAACVAAAVLAGGCYVAFTPAGPVVGIEAPSLVYIPGTQIQVVSGYDDTFYYGGYYWRVDPSGVWYRSRMWNGGWAVYHSIPRVFLGIPPAHPSYRVVRWHPQFKVTAPIKAPAPHAAPAKHGIPTPAPAKGAPAPASPAKKKKNAWSPGGKK